VSKKGRLNQSSPEVNWKKEGEKNEMRGETLSGFYILFQ
jgi:hypothetical protein